MWPGTHASVLVSALIILQKEAVIAAAIGNLGIARLRHAICAFAVGGLVPRAERNRSSRIGARSLKRALVLLRAVDVIRELVVQVDMIKLRGGLIVLGGPSLAAIGCEGGAT